MGAHSYIEKEDLGLTVLGVTQYSYTVNGVHRQDYDTAIFRAALCRSVACEEALNAYVELVNKRREKLDQLGYGLAQINSALGSTTEAPKSDTEFDVDEDAVIYLQQYGFTTASTVMKYETLMRLVQDVEYEMDQEDNDLQQDMTTMQSFVTKRDDAMQMSNKLMKKIAKTRQKGIQYIGS